VLENWLRLWYSISFDNHICNHWCKQYNMQYFTLPFVVAVSTWSSLRQLAAFDKLYSLI